MVYLDNGKVCLALDETTGQPVSVTRGSFTLPLDGFAFDLGRDERMISGVLEYESMLEFRTWHLPAIRPTGKPFPFLPQSVVAADDAVRVQYALDGLTVLVRYRCFEQAVQIDLDERFAVAAHLFLRSSIFLTIVMTSQISAMARAARSSRLPMDMWAGPPRV